MIINLNEAFKRQSNLVAFNFFNIETISGILDAAQEKDRIVILSFGESYMEHTPIEVAAAMASEYSKLYKKPFVLHLDHATRMETVEKALHLGFSSVMFDGSKLTLEENIFNTTMAVQHAKRFGATVEGELGYLNNEDGSDEIELVYTSVKDSLRFVSETGVDALAVAVGNAHGIYKSKPSINVDRIKEIHASVGVPLVLHGSSGIPMEVLAQSFEAGVGKINVNTELALAGCRGTREYMDSFGENPRFENAMRMARVEIKKAAMEFLDL
ncbi:class II fructose-bisphosphate aldolase [Youngiibacter fragilis]|uniref:Tagatose-bisphosphate aldolase n=1 Tax=Youngiibacter fragilis 232.1 TaxID=994573 RepID=V7I5X4_9CLOT|nr:class II fructose-bisphosphate aldolase [Youngiibacter fragilis]ETA80701.1 tagatose-bisphosphate aldolase [Youngiibacter fragilis 232.1]